MGNDVEDMAEQFICTGCVGDAYLSADIEKEGLEEQCAYCGETSLCFRLGEMADRIESAFEDHFARTAQEPDSFEWAMSKDPEIQYSWERDGEPTVYAIMNAAEIPEDAARDIQEILADRHGDYEAAQMGMETEFADDAQYEEIMPTDRAWREGWQDFEKSIKTEARFFSRTGAEKLGALFDDIDRMRTKSGRPIIVQAGPSHDLKFLYRARVFQSDSKLEAALMRPDRELAAPPSAFAAAGRMNAKGISTFYGATDAEIALAEVRPPVGSQVALARFEIVRDLKLLDLNALTDIHEDGSIFDPTYARRLGRMTFLRSLRDRIARPVMPDDQDSEYLPTQAVADYLATEGKVPLDGILFPSVQADGKGLNAVLFHKASRCQEMDIPKGTELSARSWQQYEDEIERDYTVIEEVPPEKPKPPKKAKHPFDFDDVGPVDWNDVLHGDHRQMTLRIDTGSVRVHVVNSAKFGTSEYEVARHRWTKSDNPF